MLCMGSPTNIALYLSHLIRPLKTSKYHFYAKTPKNTKISKGWKFPIRGEDRDFSSEEKKSTGDLAVP